MQRIHFGSCNSAVGSSSIGGIQARETSRAESPVVSPNYPLNSRRSSPQAPYRLICDKEQLNSRLGPPDFYPPNPYCPEETLTREYVQHGYRETVEGLEESRETSLSQIQYFTKPLIVKCKEAIRKCHRAINESRAQKRKAGQVYGLPLSGNLLTKSSVFPEQRPCGDDLKKKWIEGLSQPHKRLRLLADQVPHAYRRKSLLEVLIRNNVPLLRATWFVKVIYLNQFRASSSNSSSGFHEKIPLSRSEHWTKDVIEYLQHLLNEFVARNTHSSLQLRDMSPSQVAHSGSLWQKGDSVTPVTVSGEPSLHTKWWYVVRIIHWHHAEGLIIPSLVIDWVLDQLQDKESLGVLQLLLPVIYSIIEAVVLSQTYVRSLVRIAIRYIREPAPGGSDLVDNSRRAYTTSAVVEMLRYLILAVPDTFVSLDCFPLPACVINPVVKDGQIEASGVFRDGKIHEAQADSSFRTVVSSIKKRAQILSKAAKGSPGNNVARVLKALDQSLMSGDIGFSFKMLFDNVLDGASGERWLAEVNPSLYASLKHIGTVKLSLICSVFLICEWATCEYRDFRTSPPRGVKFTGRKDLSQIYIAVRLLKSKMSSRTKSRRKKKNHDISATLESSGPLHDVIVCWIDQHEASNREGFKRLQLLIRELVKAGIFNPLAYVRELIVSGITDGNVPTVDVERCKRHYKLLKQLPPPYVRDSLQEAEVALPHVLEEAMSVYSTERGMALHGLLSGQRKTRTDTSGSSEKKRRPHGLGLGHRGVYPSSVDNWYFPAKSEKISSDLDSGNKLEELKASISALLHLPLSLSCTDKEVDESQWSNKGTNHRTDGDEISACDECKRAKRQKLSKERSSFLLEEEEETWWVGKEMKYIESLKSEPPLKPTKQASRGKRKTQSLAHLSAVARIESSQGASTSHLCENDIGCPNHRTGSDEISKSADATRKQQTGDIVLIGKLLKQMRFIDKRDVTVWLISSVKQLIEEAEKSSAKVGQYGSSSRPLAAPVDDRGSIRWRLGDEELSTILYIIDTCDDLVSLVRFLLWLLPKVPTTSGSIVFNRNTVMLPRNGDNHSWCEVGEPILLSSIRRYENVIAAADLIPETLSAAMARCDLILASNGRLSGSLSLVYARQLLRKYADIASVISWESTFKSSTSDRRLISELESVRSSESDYHTLGVPNGVDNPDDYIRQKISGVRLSRVGMSMKEIVHRHIDEGFPSFNSRDRKQPLGLGPNKSPVTEKWANCHQIAHKIVVGLMDCMRQTGGAAQEGDPSLVSSAIAAVINSVGQVIARIPDLTTSTNHSNLQSQTSSGSLHLARQILRVHISCLCMLKEALGERQSRVFEVALATEASSALSQAFASAKASRMSSESHDFNAGLPSDASNHSNKSSAHSRAVRTTAAVSAVVVGAILQGVAALERMVTLFRLKEGLDLIQLIRSLKSSANGNARSGTILKVDNSIEVTLNWFRVLVGNCKTVCDGLIALLLGEASVLALSRMQRMLSVNLVFPPAYSVFAFVIWKPILDVVVGAREDLQQLYQSMEASIDDVIRHIPFRDICFKDTHVLCDIIAADTLDSEFASLVEYHGSDHSLKASSSISLRCRLFLDSLLDCKIPESVSKIDGKNWIPSQGELKRSYGENVKKLVRKLVHALDTLQPAKFHWQWVELRLLLNEQAVNERLENDFSAIEALRPLSSSHDKATASENESNFVQIVLTRLLVRPDAAPLFSEVVHLLGKSLEDSMLSQAKWLLRGVEVLYGKKSIRQKVLNIAAELKDLSLKPPYWRPWGWCHSDPINAVSKADKAKSEIGSNLEEGEFVDEGSYAFNQLGKGSGFLDMEGFIVSQQHVTERALIELIVPCVDQGSDDLRYNFASEMIKQISNIEQQINSVTCGVIGKQAMPSSPASKGNNRKTGKGTTSPMLSRQPMSGSSDTVPPSPAALRASMTLRLQFLIRLLPIICNDREPSGRNMRYTLASVILRLLGSRVVYEDSSHYANPALISSKRDVKSLVESSPSALLLYNDSLFDCLLLVLHVLLSRDQPSWFGPKPKSNHADHIAAFDREVAERLQNDLDRMELPETIRFRIQSAMPYLFPSARHTISSYTPAVPPSALSCLQSSNQLTTLLSPPMSQNSSQKNSASLPLLPSGRTARNKPQTPQHENETEIDQWTLLEDGTGSNQTPSNSGAGNNPENGSNLKAAFWLKGAVRVRRTNLTCIGEVDEDS